MARRKWRRRTQIGYSVRGRALPHRPITSLTSTNSAMAILCVACPALKLLQSNAEVANAADSRRRSTHCSGTCTYGQLLLHETIAIHCSIQQLLQHGRLNAKRTTLFPIELRTTDELINVTTYLAELLGKIFRPDMCPFRDFGGVQHERVVVMDS